MIPRELVSTQPNEFDNDKSTLEQLVRVQHYSLPTRLLDVTWNPLVGLVGLYFAAKESDKVTAEVVVFRAKKDLVKYYDSDTASIIANLAHLSKQEKCKIDFKLDGAKFND